MNVIFLILTGINAFVFLYALLIDFQDLIENKTLRKAFLSGANLAKKMEDDIKKEINKPAKVGKTIGFVLAILFSLLSIVALLIPIYIGFKINVETAITTYLLILLITTIPRLIRMGKERDFNEEHMILTSLVGLFKFQFIIVLLFGFKFSLKSIVLDIYMSNFYLSNALTILTPILFYWSIIITIYLFWKGLTLNSELPQHKKKRINLSDFLIILVISSIAGLIVLFEMEIDTQNNIAFDRILDLVSVVLGSILIPSLFSIFNKKDHSIEKNEEDKAI